MHKSQVYNQLQNLFPQTSSRSAPMILDMPARLVNLHFSGYDPRAAGGRQTVKLELRAELDAAIQELRFDFRSELLTPLTSHQVVQRSPAGIWPSLLLSFSSKGKEHGQYPLQVQLSYFDAIGCEHYWTCTSIIFLPRANASLSEIHQVFLASQKNVRLYAEDGAIATLSGAMNMPATQHRHVNIDIVAKDAAIAQWDVATESDKAQLHSFEMGLSSIAWDEVMLEVAAPMYAGTRQLPPSTKPLSSFSNRTNAQITSTSSSAQKLEAASAQIDMATPDSRLDLISRQDRPRWTQAQQQSAHLAFKIHVVVQSEWIIGRASAEKPRLNLPAIALTHPHLSSRMSAQHARIRLTACGAEIIDISRYGMRLNNLILEKNQPMPLFAGMLLEMSACFSGLPQLQVLHVLPHALILAQLPSAHSVSSLLTEIHTKMKTQVSAPAQVYEIFYLLTPELRPEASLPALFALPAEQGELPLLFHQQGKIQVHDTQTQLDRSVQEMCADPSQAWPYQLLVD